MRTNRRMPRASLAALGLAFLVCLPLAACSNLSSPGDEGSSEVAEGDVPEFSGPWAQELRAAYLKAPDNDVRKYLSDGSVSDMEKQAVTDRFRTCLSTQGVTFDDFKDDGGFDFGFREGVGPDKANKITDECSKSTGVDAVIGLYYQMRANPENKDMSAEIAACLVRSGAVPSDFTAEEYKAAPIQEYALVDELEAVDAVRACETDPIGSFGG